MNLPNEKHVYCDANFLVAYGAKEIKQKDLQEKAKKIFAQLLVNKCILVASPLVFDETWNAIRIECGMKKIHNQFRFKIGKILQKIGLRFIHQGNSNFSYSDIISDLKIFTNSLINSPKFKIVQFPVSEEAKGVEQALDNIENFKLKPRDSFHLSILQKNNINHLVTGDKGFNIEGMGINVISFN